MRFSTATVLSALAALATAYTQPDYSKPPTGNPISSPGLNEQIPEGKPFTITWDPTTKGDVSLVLLRGPSSNVQPLETIVEKIPNSGSYVWTPGTNLTPDTTHYGLLLVVEGTGQYQWSTQFGISAPAGSSPGSGSGSGSGYTTTTTSTTSSTTTESTTSTTTTTTKSTTTTSSSTESTTSSTTTTTAVTTTTAASAPTTTITTVVIPNPSNTAAQSSTLRATTPPSPTTPASPTTTPFNAAGRNAVSVGAAAVAGVLAFAMAC
ncbi:GPI anchored serine-threonine rich protein [Penicillium riverlandense]|uniref:GPI anchored serine-threonine rich protein n=1 Tax=Penicillium riverlandense TaxID=1903569 RepID=UPI002549380A|nr:GPI anchored serine-threonine rich protein [Penicillium riverlandense]KAJ5818443.1 GPI anchored serine-threonine rich protein [Penicillium riverlandense]